MGQGISPEGAHGMTFTPLFLCFLKRGGSPSKLLSISPKFQGKMTPGQEKGGFSHAQAYLLNGMDAPPF